MILAGLLVLLTAACACLPADHVHERAFWRQRDQWLLILVGVGGIAAALAGEYWLSPIALWFVVRWRSNAPLASLVVWTAIAATWILTVSVIRADRPTVSPTPLAGVLLMIATWQVVYAIRQWLVPTPGRMPTRAPRGTFGQRTLLASYLALVAPLGLALWPGGLIPSGVAVAGLVLTSSWVAWAAALAALVVLYPLVGAVVATLIVSFVAGAILANLRATGGPLQYVIDHWTIRGSSVDSLRQRVRTWRVILHMYAHPVLTIDPKWPMTRYRYEITKQRARAWAFGFGPTTLQYDLLRWDHRFKAELINGYAHCEPIHVLYEYGLCGVAAMLLFGWRVGVGLHIGDPWSAAAVAGAIAACGTITCRTPSTGIPWLVICAVVAARS